MVSTARARRPVRLLATLLVAVALVSAPLAAQTPDTRTMQPALDALLAALQQKNFDLLAPYLDASFHVGGIAGPMASQLLSQIVNGGFRTASALHVESVTPDGANLKAVTRFEFADGEKALDLVFTPQGKIVELPLFRVQMGGGAAPPGGAPQGGLRMRMGGEAPGGAAAPASPARAASDPALRGELLAMQAEDQRYRAAAMGVNGAAPDPEAQRKMVEADSANVRKLEAIVARHGWPGAALVGDDGAMAAFLVLQHADGPTQERHLSAVRAAAGRGELPRSALALLEDRVRMRRGEKQIYGTQLRQDPATRAMSVYPIEDEANVDARRAEVGLPPLAQYLARFGVTWAPSPRP